MLRLALVGTIIVAGSIASLQSAFYALLFYLWIAYFRPEMWIWGDALQGAGLSLYCGTYLVLSTALRGQLRWIGTAGMLMVVFCLHSMVSTLASPASSYCWPFWMDFAKSTVISCLMIMLITDYSKLRLALVVICLSLGLEGAKQGLVQMISDPGERNMNIVAFLGDNNGVAVGMLMLTPVLLALAQTTDRLAVRWGYRVMAFGTVFRALGTYSRGGLLAFIAMCGMYWVRSTRKLLALVAVLIIGAGALSVMPSAYWDRMSTMQTTDEDEMEDSAASRLYFWGVGVKIALANPVLGVGHNGFSQAFDQFDETGGRYGTKRAVHSTWFGVLADLGFPGLILFVSIFVSSWWRCSRVRAAAMARGDTRVAVLASAIETALVSFAVGSTFLSFQYVEMLWHFFALSIALQRLPVEQPVPETSLSAWPAATPALG